MDGYDTKWTNAEMISSSLKKHLLLVSLIAVITLALSACAPSQDDTISEAPDSIKIAALSPLTGPASGLGGQHLLGYELAVDKINQDGGIYVKQFDKKIPLELLVFDIESSGEQAIARAEAAYERGVVACVGSTWVEDAAGTFEKNQVPVIVTASSARDVHERGYKYWFGITIKVDNVAEGIFNLLDSLPEANRPSKVAIFEEQTDIGVLQSEYFQKEATERGYNIVLIEKYSPLSRDFSPLLIAAKDAGADALLTQSIMPDGMTIVRQMKELDYRPNVTVTVMAADDLDWTGAMGSLGDYVIGMGGWHHDMDFPGVADLNSIYQEMNERPADIFVGPAYAAVQVLAVAIERAGSLEREKIRNAISATDMMTVAGPVKFHEDGSNETPCNAVYQWQDGKQVLVWPPDHSTGTFVYPMPEWNMR